MRQMSLMPAKVRPTPMKVVPRRNQGETKWARAMVRRTSRPAPILTCLSSDQGFLVADCSGLPD